MIGSLRTLVFMFQNNSPSDCLAFLMNLNSISESQSNKIDIKKSAKENQEVLHTFHVGMDKVVQAKV